MYNTYVGIMYICTPYVEGREKLGKGHYQNCEILNPFYLIYYYYLFNYLINSLSKFYRSGDYPCQDVLCTLSSFIFHSFIPSFLLSPLPLKKYLIFFFSSFFSLPFFSYTVSSCVVNLAIHDANLAMPQPGARIRLVKSTP